MGCVSSKKDFDDSHPNIFQVMNVDDLGVPLSPGQLEITDVDLIFYQRDKPPVTWPLRTLRRYGHECDMFSFESGRRCPTGPGIYAFKCKRAEQLFNLMQHRIQCRSNVDNELLPVFQSLTNNQTRTEGNYLEPAPLRRSRSSIQNVSDPITRLSSVGSASGSLGPLSPQSGSIPTEMPPPPLVKKNSCQNLYANENIIAASLNNTNTTSDETNNNKQSPVTPLYANFNITEGEMVNENGTDTSYEILSEMLSPKLDLERVYVNVVPGVEPFSPTTKQIDWDSDETKRCYANLDPTELENVYKLTKKSTVVNKSINYIVLDLKPGNNVDVPKSPTSSLPPESPIKTTQQEGYVTIDFDKTVALSHSVNPNFDNADGSSRKTRHNSTINDLISQSRNSTSLSD